MKIWIIFLCAAVFSSKITSKDYRALIDKPLVAKREKSLIEMNKKTLIAYGLDVVLKALICMITFTEYNKMNLFKLIGLDFLLNVFLSLAVFVKFIQWLWGPNRQLRQLMFLLLLPISHSLVAYLGSSYYTQGTIIHDCIGYTKESNLTTGLELIDQQKYVFVLGTCSTAASLTANINEVVKKICHRVNLIESSISGTKSWLEVLKKPLKTEWAIEYPKCTEGEFLEVEEAARKQEERMQRMIQRMIQSDPFLVPQLKKRGINYICDDGEIPNIDTRCCDTGCPVGCVKKGFSFVYQNQWGNIPSLTYKSGEGEDTYNSSDSSKQTLQQLCTCSDCKYKLY